MGTSIMSWKQEDLAREFKCPPVVGPSRLVEGLSVSAL